VTSPCTTRLFRVLEATWPPKATREAAGWTLRDGAGGGKRVSAATAGPEAGAREAPALVQIRPWNAGLSDALAGQGYRMVDETVLYLCPASLLAGPLLHGSAYWTQKRLAIMDEIWAAGGIGPGRLAVMDRVPAPKATLLCRAGDRAAGVGFVAIAEGVAMVHAVEVLVQHRRGGAGRLMMRAAATWAIRNGADWLALAVTVDNVPARALYEGLGMNDVAHYHYRMIET
jgi:GNAT superfamily N-acetyltransferase